MLFGAPRFGGMCAKTVSQTIAIAGLGAAATFGEDKRFAHVHLEAAWHCASL
jgi:hypothetical protein